MYNKYVCYHTSLPNRDCPMIATFIGLGPVDPSLLDKGAVLLNVFREVSNRVRGIDDLALPNCDKPCLRVETVAVGYKEVVVRVRRQCNVETADVGSFFAVVVELRGTM